MFILHWLKGSLHSGDSEDYKETVYSATNDKDRTTARKHTSGARAKRASRFGRNVGIVAGSTATLRFGKVKRFISMSEQLRNGGAVVRES